MAKSSNKINIKQRVFTGLIMAVGFAIVAFLIVYVVFCFINGWNLAIDLSSTYILAIIRIIVVVILSIVSIVIVPFTLGAEIVAYGLLAAKIGMAVGFVIGLFVKSE